MRVANKILQIYISYIFNDMLIVHVSNRVESNDTFVYVSRQTLN